MLSQEFANAAPAISTTYDRIWSSLGDMTSVQKEEFVSGLIGKTVIWPGTVKNVYDGVDFSQGLMHGVRDSKRGKLSVDVFLSKKLFSGTTTFVLPKSIAAKMRIGQKLRFSGVIKNVEETAMGGPDIKFADLKILN